MEKSNLVAEVMGMGDACRRDEGSPRSEHGWPRYEDHMCQACATNVTLLPRLGGLACQLL